MVVAGGTFEELDSHGNRDGWYRLGFSRYFIFDGFVLVFFLERVSLVSEVRYQRILLR